MNAVRLSFATLALSLGLSACTVEPVRPYSYSSYPYVVRPAPPPAIVLAPPPPPPRVIVAPAPPPPPRVVVVSPPPAAPVIVAPRPPSGFHGRPDGERRDAGHDHDRDRRRGDGGPGRHGGRDGDRDH